VKAVVGVALLDAAAPLWIAIAEQNPSVVQQSRFGYGLP